MTLRRAATLLGHEKQVSNSSDSADCVVGHCHCRCFGTVSDSWSHFRGAPLAPLPAECSLAASSLSYPANSGCQNNRESRNPLASQDGTVVLSAIGALWSIWTPRSMCGEAVWRGCGKLSTSPRAPLKSFRGLFGLRQLSVAD